MSEIRKTEIYNFLIKLVGQYEQLEAERLYLINEGTARVTAIQAEKQELITEAQEQLDKLNQMRLVDGQDNITLQDLRALVGNRSGPRG